MVAVVKRDLSAGLKLEGIGGHHVHGITVPASDARSDDLIPIGASYWVHLAERWLAKR